MTCHFKECSSCGKVQNLSQFYKNAYAKDGYRGTCKECVREQRRIVYHKKMQDIEFVLSERERNRNRQKKRVKKPKEKRRIWNQNYRNKYPEKRKAHTIVQYALEKGDLVKQPCEICAESKVEAHHDDYSKPLEVRWLCNKHHNELHRILRKHELLKVI